MNKNTISRSDALIFNKVGISLRVPLVFSEFKVLFRVSNLTFKDLGHNYSLWKVAGILYVHLRAEFHPSLMRIKKKRIPVIRVDCDEILIT